MTLNGVAICDKGQPLIGCTHLVKGWVSVGWHSQIPQNQDLVGQHVADSLLNWVYLGLVMEWASGVKSPLPSFSQCRIRLHLLGIPKDRTDFFTI